MKIGFDYWQVVSHYPVYFDYLAHMHRSNGDKVHIISAIGKDRIGTVQAEVDKLNVQYDEVHEVVFEHPRESPELKVKKCLELGIEVFFDDRDDVCRALRAAGIIAFRVTRKDNSTYDLGAERETLKFKQSKPEEGGERFGEFQIHSKEVCQAPCPFHSPSDHPLKDARIHIRADKDFLVERICVHGVGHDDPDSVAFMHKQGKTWAGTHGCDGCCTEAVA